MHCAVLPAWAQHSRLGRATLAAPVAFRDSTKLQRKISKLPSQVASLRSSDPTIQLYHVRTMVMGVLDVLACFREGVVDREAEVSTFSSSYQRILEVSKISRADVYKVKMVS